MATARGAWRGSSRRGSAGRAGGRRARARAEVLGVGAAARADSAKRELLESLAAPGAAAGKARTAAARRTEELVRALEEVGGEGGGAAVAGRWRLLSTFTMGAAAADFLSVESWREYVFGSGPSPVQAAVVGSGTASSIYQIVDVEARRWYNVVELPFGVLEIEADLTSVDVDTGDLDFRWTGGNLWVTSLPWRAEPLDSPVRVPYPVPFDLLGDRAKGTFANVYCDDDLRVAVGSKSGSYFVLAREPDPLPLEDSYRPS